VSNRPQRQSSPSLCEGKKKKMIRAVEKRDMHHALLGKREKKVGRTKLLRKKENANEFSGASTSRVGKKRKDLSDIWNGQAALLCGERNGFPFPPASIQAHSFKKGDLPLQKILEGRGKDFQPLYM